jgi:hypothetical protein
LLTLRVVICVSLATSGEALNCNNMTGTWPDSLLALRVVISLLCPCCSLPCREELLVCSLHCAAATDVERLQRRVHLGGHLHNAVHLTLYAGCFQKYTYVKHLFIYVTVCCCIGSTGSVCCGHRLSGCHQSLSLCKAQF